MKALLLAAALLPLPAVLAADPPPAAKSTPLVAIDRQHVDADFAFQGEYTGKLDDKPAGIQIVALGGGKFDAVLYRGGLPGAGWTGDKAKLERGKGSLSGESVQLSLASLQGSITTGKLTLGKDTFERVERKSDALGAKAPTGAVILFDGSNTNAWEGSGMTEDKLLKEGQNTKQKFQSYTLHLEFMLPYKPDARGQERGNSGFYNQSRYEVQILDSFGLEGKDNECGGIYTIKAPDLNMCLPPLQWQTYDINYTAAKFDAKGAKTANARVTVKHNGVAVHKDVELPHATTAAPLAEGPGEAPLHLQNHGNPVRYRNVWLVESK